MPPNRLLAAVDTNSPGAVALHSAVWSTTTLTLVLTSALNDQTILRGSLDPAYRHLSRSDHASRSSSRAEIRLGSPLRLMAECLLTSLEQPPDHRGEDELHREIHLASGADDGVRTRHE
jgi:hypothetical protein